MTDLEIEDAAPPPEYRDPEYHRPIEPFERSKLYRQWHKRVQNSDNDYIIVIAAASKSAVSGVGKTTLAITMANWFDLSSEGFDPESKATLDAGEFARDMLANPDRVPDGSAVIYDEGQGTLSDTGADARRSMAHSVMDVTTALSTMRFRQLTPIIVSQSTKWIDKRVDDILDALVLIQPTEKKLVTAEIFTTYYNDLEGDATRYVERMDSATWDPIDTSHPQYQYLHELKAKSATASLEGEDEDTSIPKEQQIQLAQYRRDQGDTAETIASHPMIEFGIDWVYKHTEPRGDN